MIIKMIQNLENKMELQINSLETKIEKMQEMFNSLKRKDFRYYCEKTNLWVPIHQSLSDSA